MTCQSKLQDVRGDESARLTHSRNILPPIPDPSVRYVPVRQNFPKITSIETDREADAGRQMPYLRWQRPGSLGHPWKDMCILWYALLD